MNSLLIATYSSPFLSCPISPALSLPSGSGRCMSWYVLKVLRCLPILLVSYQ